MWSAAHEGLDQAAEIISKTYYADEVTTQPDQQPAERAARRAVVRPGAILELFKTPYGIRTLLVSILVVTQAVGLRRLAVMGYAVTFGCLAVISGPSAARHPGGHGSYLDLLREP